ncbi:MAG TPA: VTT domain-containing protein, partial [Povalibacter sp.]|nr:VTT domain-containing protein [Povalibacter sp.]
RLRAADAHDRLRIVYPYIDGLRDGTCIDVHSKMMIVDDDIVRIGSANLANRSMGLDTECDLTLHAGGHEAVRASIRALRATLLAEHMGATPESVQATLGSAGSIRSVLSELRQEQRTLQPLEDMPQTSESLLSVASVVDAERPVGLADLAKIFSADDSAADAATTPAWGKIAIIAAVVCALAALWQFTPARELLDGYRIVRWAREFGGNWWAPLVTMLAYTPAALTMFPRSPITLFAVVAFGPLLGFIYAMAGLEFAAWVTYFAGQQLDRDTVRRIAGRKLNDVIQVLRRRGLVAVTALRLVPLAPFSIEGVIAGAVGIRLWHFMVGTAIGILPGTLAATVFGHQLQGALEGTSHVNYWLLATVLAVVILATWLVRRWLMRSAAQLRPGPALATQPTAPAATSSHGIGSANAV